MSIQSHRDLIVWQRGMELTAESYLLAKLLSREEQFPMTNQLLRAAASVPANAAAGQARGTRKDDTHFVTIARGSCAETETFLMLIAKVELLSSQQVERALSLCSEIGKMLNTLVTRLREQS